MKNLRLIALSAGSLLVAGSASLVACSDDTSVNPTIDSGGGTDGNTTDSPITEDGGVDARADVTPDAGATVDTFAGLVADRLCRSLARCCFGNGDLAGGAAVDGGTYDRDGCLAADKALGFEGSNVGALSAGAGNVTLDQQQSNECLAKVDALPCDLPAAVLQEARTACFAAYKGKLTNGTPCRGSIECASTSFCKAPGPGDGGIVGTCQPLRAANGTCGDFTDDVDYAEEACSYRSGGTPGNHCDKILDFVQGTYKPQADWKCVANVANGESCASSNWCASGICDFADTKCKSPFEYFAGGCQQFTKP